MKTQNVKDYIGLTLNEAKKLAKESEFRVRITKRDGSHHVITQDYRTDRINVWVEKDIVKHAYVG